MGFKDFVFSDEDIEDLNKQALLHKKEYTEKATMFEKEERPYVAWLQEGSSIIRVYPDRDKNGKIRFMKKIFTHRALPVSDKRTARVWASKRVDSLIAEIEKAGMKTLFGEATWKWKSQEGNLMAVHFFASDDTERHPAGCTCILNLSAKQAFAVNDWLASLHPEEKRELLNPMEDAAGIRVSNTKGQKSNVNVSIAGMRKLHLPWPPALWDSSWKGVLKDGGSLDGIKTHPFNCMSNELDGLYITEEDSLTDQEFEFIRTRAYTELEAFKVKGGGANVKDMTGKGHNFDKQEEPQQPRPFGMSPSPSEPPRPRVVSDNDTGGRECPLAEKIKTNDKTASLFGSDAPKIKFGHYPGKPNPACQMCPHENECRKLTKERQAKAA